MQMKAELFRCVVLAITFGLFSCSDPERNVTLPPETDATTPEVSTPDDLANVTKLFNKEGFRVPCVEESEIKTAKKRLASPGTLADVFVETRSRGKCTADEQDIFERLSPGAGAGQYEREVYAIAVYHSVRGRPFAHTILFKMKHAGAINELTYLDSDDNGTFDTVFQSASMRKPVIPPWLKLSHH